MIGDAKSLLEKAKAEHDAAGAASSASVFGQSLIQVSEFTEEGVWKLPSFLTCSLEHVRQHGLSEEGIFRVSGV
ncbi:MAG: hypothetical protein Q8P67_24080, partial [archaeon]|nr:hypothetical protein [archaeon]